MEHINGDGQSCDNRLWHGCGIGTTCDRTFHESEAISLMLMGIPGKKIPYADDITAHRHGLVS
jgi:hypothetical protein